MTWIAVIRLESRIYQASMSKRKKTQVSEENQELPIFKAKKTQKRKSQATRDCNLEKPAEVSDSSNTLAEATAAVAVQECKEHSLDHTVMNILPTGLDASLAEESKNASSERKESVKSFVSPSQGARLVPMFVKARNKVPERCEDVNGDAPAIQMKRDVLESSEAECMFRNVPCDTAVKAFQHTTAPSESLEFMDLSVKNKEDTGDQGILPHEGTQDVKIQNQDRIVSVNNGDAVSGLIDSQVEEAQKPTDTPANISEKQKMKSKKRVSFFLSMSDNKDAKGFEERELSPGSLGHVKRNQNEDAPEGPTLQTEHGTKNRCEKLVPIIKQSNCDTCDLRPNEISQSLPKIDDDQQMDGKEKREMCAENKLFCVEGCVSAEIISQLDGAVVRNESSRENPGAEAQGPMAQIDSPIKDFLSVDLDFLLDSQVQGVFESNSLDHPLHKPFSLDVPYTARETKSIANVAQPNNARDEMIARVCAPSKEEDATNVVCGLIKELSKLNRLVMSTHRGLDSFKRMKFRRYRQSGKLLPHSMDATTNMQYTVKKKKMSLANALANFNICKDFLCSSNISSAVKSKAVAVHNVEVDV